jgi:hypothetical protein
VLVFLYSVYLYAFAILLGADLARAWQWPETPDETPLPLLDRLRTAAVGLVKTQDGRRQP